MISIVDFRKKEKEDGSIFFVLVVEGQPDVIQSSTGNFYVAARKTQIATTLSEEGCKAMIGKKLPGVIEKVECEPYEYVVPSTGKTVELDFTYRYNPTVQSVEEAVFGGGN